MKILMNQLLSLKDIYEKLKNEPMSIRVAYKLNKIFDGVFKDLVFYQSKVSELLKQYGQVDENGNYVRSEDGLSILLIPEKIEECTKALRELDAIEVEMPDISLTLDELENFKLTLQEMALLESFIVE